MSAFADASPSRHLRAPQGPTETERLRALRKANEVRAVRARLKRQIAIGEVTIAQLLLDPPAEALTWRLGDVLMSQPRWGKTKCRRFLAITLINEHKPIGRLTVRQRNLLIAKLRGD